MQIRIAHAERGEDHFVVSHPQRREQRAQVGNVVEPVRLIDPASAQPQRVKDEIEDFHLSTLKLTFDEVISEYEKRKETSIGRLVARRELPVVYRAKEILDEMVK